MRIVNVVELRTDGEDTVKEFLTVEVVLSDGTNALIELTLDGAYALRAILDAVPELDSSRY